MSDASFLVGSAPRSTTEQKDVWCKEEVQPLPPEDLAQCQSNEGHDVGLRAMWFSSVGTMLGALMYWVLTYQETGVDLAIVGVVFMIRGVVSFVVSSLVFLLSLRRPATIPRRRHPLSLAESESPVTAHGKVQ